MPYRQHDHFISKKNWRFVKIVDKQSKMLPSFSKETCIHFCLKYFDRPGLIGNQPRLKQRSVIITLLNLKNAIGEVHKNLIRFVFDYRHIPDSVQSLIANLYTNFHSCLISENFTNPFLPFQRGVLQGDCLSPLLSSSSTKNANSWAFYHTMSINICSTL